MGGIDNGSIQSGVFFQAKQFGSLLRGSGPPVSQAGVLGDLYVDVQTWNLYSKRSSDTVSDVDPWGHYIFVVPPTYQLQLKWFSTSAPDDSVGVTGDYCLAWAGFGNYGLQPFIYGPKGTNNTWPENGNGPSTLIVTGGVFPLGLSGEGTQVAYSTSTQLITAGIVDEYVAATPVANVIGTPVGQIGLRQQPTPVAVTLNTLYTFEDSHAI
jgi:hypothetical protein